MKKVLLMSACVISINASSASAQTAWIEDSLSEMCSAASRSEVAQMTRQSIEESVARAHSSIRVPAPIEDLSCLNDLMQAPIDIFSNGGKFLSGFNLTNLVNSVTNGLKAGFSLEKLAEGVEAAICKFAKEKFDELTGGLTGTMDEILSGANASNFFDNFDKSSQPGGSTSQSGTPQDVDDGDTDPGNTNSGTNDGDFVVPLDQLDFGPGGNFAFTEQSSDGNYLPNGAPMIDGDQFAGGQLRVNVTSLFDADGIQRETGEYQWYIDGQPWPFATGETFGAGPEYIGSVVTYSYSYVDGRGKQHTVFSNGKTIISREEFDSLGFEPEERPRNEIFDSIWNSIGGTQ